MPVHPQEQKKEVFDDSFLLGKWDWNHDGTKKNGELILRPDGKVVSTFGGNPGNWKRVSDGQYMICMCEGSANHIMNLSADKKTFVLIEPKRNPASTAT